MLDGIACAVPQRISPPRTEGDSPLLLSPIDIDCKEQFISSLQCAAINIQFLPPFVHFSLPEVASPVKTHTLWGEIYPIALHRVSWLGDNGGANIN
jgi:hypothetical protein